MKIGTMITLQPYGGQARTKLKFYSKMVEENEKYFFITLPTEEKTKKTAILPNGTKWLVTYSEKDSTGNYLIFQFKTKIIQKKNMDIPVLVMERPKKEDIQPVQRREFVRVKTTIDLAVHPKEGISPFTTVTVDISAGGLAMIVPQKVILTLDERMTLWLVIPKDDENYEYINLEGTVVRIPNPEDSIQIGSVKFNALKMKQEQKLTQLCFQIQRQQIREKKLYRT